METKDHLGIAGRAMEQLLARARAAPPPPPPSPSVWQAWSPFWLQDQRVEIVQILGEKIRGIGFRDANVRYEDAIQTLIRIEGMERHDLGFDSWNPASQYPPDPVGFEGETYIRINGRWARIGSLTSVNMRRRRGHNWKRVQDNVPVEVFSMSLDLAGLSRPHWLTNEAEPPNHLKLDDLLRIGPCHQLGGVFQEKATRDHRLIRLVAKERRKARQVLRGQGIRGIEVISVDGDVMIAARHGEIRRLSLAASRDMGLGAAFLRARVI